MHNKSLNVYKSPKPPSYSKNYYTRFKINGESVRQSLGTTNAIDAERISLELYRKYLAACSAPGEKPDYTVDKTLAEYVKHEGKFKASFKAFYKPKVVRFREFFGADKLWSTISDKDIAEYVVYRREQKVQVNRTYTEAGHKRTVHIDGNRPVSNATINKELIILNRINNVVSDKLGAKPAQFKISKHKLNTRKPDRRFLTAENAALIYKELEAPWADAFRFCLITGLRASHVFGRHTKDRLIRKSDVDMINGILTIRAKSRNDIGGKILKIPLVPEALDILLRQGIMAKEPEDFIFVYPEGHRLAGKPLGDYRKALYPAMERAGFDRKFGEAMHMTRHTIASWMAISGVPIAVLKEFLGHADIGTTQMYAHLQLTDINRALNNTLAENVQSKNDAEKNNGEL